MKRKATKNEIKLKRIGQHKTKWKRINYIKIVESDYKQQTGKVTQKELKKV